MNNRNSGPPSPDDARRLLALAVLALFVGVCVGRLVAPEAPLFRELLPAASGLLLVVVRFYFKGSEQG